MSNCPTSQECAERSAAITSAYPLLLIEEDKVGQLDSRTKLRLPDLSTCLEKVVSSQLPPWRAVPSRSAAKLLDVGLQTLSNWRLREIGPTSEPMRRGYGNRVYYRPDALLEWLSQGELQKWVVARAWLQRWVGAEPELSEAAVLECADNLDEMGMFPEVRDLWRTFQNRVI